METSSESAAKGREQEQSVDETTENEQEDTDTSSDNDFSHLEEEQQEPAKTDEVTLMLKVKELEQLADGHYKRYLRAQADLENVRRRAQVEREQQAKYGNLPLIEKLLPVLDNLERALTASQQSGDAEALGRGVEMVAKNFWQTLQAEGLEEIASEGELFDPEVHQAISQVEETDLPEGTIVQQLQKGYRLKDRVLRAAMVSVSKQAE